MTSRRVGDTPLVCSEASFANDSRREAETRAARLAAVQNKNANVSDTRRPRVIRLISHGISLQLSQELDQHPPSQCMDSRLCASARTTLSPVLQRSARHVQRTHHPHPGSCTCRERQAQRRVERTRRDLASHLQEYLDTFHPAMFSDFTNNLSRSRSKKRTTITMVFISFEISSCQFCLWPAMSLSILFAKVHNCQTLERSIMKKVSSISSSP